MTDHEPSFPTTPDDRDETSQWSTCAIAPVLDQLPPHSNAVCCSTSAIFPFHLIAACSSAERAMCHYSQSTTNTCSHEADKVSGLKGTLEW